METIEPTFTINFRNVYLNLHVAAKERTKTQLKGVKAEVYNTASVTDKEFSTSKDDKFQVVIEYEIPGMLILDDQELKILSDKESDEDKTKDVEKMKTDSEKKRTDLGNSAFKAIQEYFLWFGGPGVKDAITKDSIQTIVAADNIQIAQNLTNDYRLDIDKIQKSIKNEISELKDDEVDKKKDIVRRKSKDKFKLMCVLTYKIDPTAKESGVVK